MKKINELCKICGGKYFAKFYCRRHWMQQYKYGKIQERTTRDKNQIIKKGEYYEICLYKQNIEILRTKIDKDDYEKIKNYKWGISKNYVYSKKANMQLHQFLIGKREGFEIDHINGDTLDNRKTNLRHCLHKENTRNRKNAKGYFWNKKIKKWTATISLNYKTKWLGDFENKQDAINSREKAEKEYFGIFAK